MPFCSIISFDLKYGSAIPTSNAFDSSLLLTIQPSLLLNTTTGLSNRSGRNTLSAEQLKLLQSTTAVNPKPLCILKAELLHLYPFEINSVCIDQHFTTR